MTGIILAPGRQLPRDLSTGAISARIASDTGTRTPRQEWLGSDTGESTATRLVGHKVPAQGSGRAARNRQVPDEAENADPHSDPGPAQVPATSAGSLNVYTASASTASYATRAIAIFSQQLGDPAAAKGTRIDTYA
jgi:hypothetical protein